MACIYYLPQGPEEIIKSLTGNWSLTTSTKLFGGADDAVCFILFVQIVIIHLRITATTNLKDYKMML
jgi:hypothetical protein